MSAIVLNEKFEEASKIALPESYKGINPHNVWLYVKSYQASIRSNTAQTKTRGEVSGGGKSHGLKKVVVVLVPVRLVHLYGLAGELFSVLLTTVTMFKRSTKSRRKLHLTVHLTLLLKTENFS